MSIMWKYLDKRSATIAAIKDFESMQFIIKNTDNEVAAERESRSSYRKRRSGSWRSAWTCV